MLLDKPKDTREVIYQIGVSDADREYYLEKKDFDLAREHAFEAIRHFQELGHKCILWTCRYGQSLIEAINWLSKNNVKMDTYNENLYPLQSRKIVADVYIDDKNVFMVDNVDWYKIEEYVLGLENKTVEIKE